MILFFLQSQNELKAVKEYDTAVKSEAYEDACLEYQHRDELQQSLATENDLFDCGLLSGLGSLVPSMALMVLPT